MKGYLSRTGWLVLGGAISRLVYGDPAEALVLALAALAFGLASERVGRGEARP